MKPPVKNAVVEQEQKRAVSFPRGRNLLTGMRTQEEAMETHGRRRLVVAEPDVEGLERAHELLVPDVTVSVNVEVVECRPDVPRPHRHEQALADLVHDRVLPVHGVQPVHLRAAQQGESDPYPAAPYR